MCMRFIGSNISSFQVERVFTTKDGGRNLTFFQSVLNASSLISMSRHGDVKTDVHSNVASDRLRHVAMRLAPPTGHLLRQESDVLSECAHRFVTDLNVKTR